MSKSIPILSILKNYNRDWFKGDLIAGLTVGIMLIPQGMAYAMIAGLPPIYGLYASTVPLLLYSIFGTSQQLAVGPVAMVSLLTATGVGVLAQGNAELYISLAVLLALIVGLIQLLLGLLKLGFLVNFLSHPVISGFTSAAALIIGISQLKHLLGIELGRSHLVHEIILEAVSKINEVHWTTFAIGMIGIISIIAIKKINNKIPGLLLVVAAAIVVVWIFNLQNQGVIILGAVPGGLPEFSIPDLNWKNIDALLPTALAIALVSFMESIAVAKAVQAKHREYKVRPNQELVALGLANIGGSAFQSYPVTGGFSRTAVNEQAGAKTVVSTIVSALLIVLTLLFLTPLFYYLPNAILASVIMVAVFGLIDIEEVRFLWKANKTDFWMLVITFFATLTLGIELGIGIGVAFSLGMIIYKSTKPHAAVLGQVPGTHFYRNIDRFSNLENRPDLLIYRFDSPIYFANTEHFEESIKTLIEKKGDSLKYVIINSESISNIDSSAVHTLKSLISDLKGDGIMVLFSGVIGPVRDAMYRSELVGAIGHQKLFMSIQEAVDYIDYGMSEKKDNFKEYVLQSRVR